MASLGLQRDHSNSHAMGRHHSYCESLRPIGSVKSANYYLKIALALLTFGKRRYSPPSLIVDSWLGVTT